MGSADSGELPLFACACMPGSCENCGLRRRFSSPEDRLYRLFKVPAACGNALVVASEVVHIDGLRGMAA